MSIFKKIFNYNKITSTRESEENILKMDTYNKKVKYIKKEEDIKKEDIKDDYTSDPFFFT